MKNYILLILSIFLFIGCINNKNLEIKYPKWYTKHKQDNPMYLYAKAKSTNKKDAILIALNEIASKISISIQSSYKTTTLISKNNYNKNIQRDIQTNIKKIEFNDYKIIKEEILNNNYLILVRVDKLNLAQKIKLKIDSAIKKANNSIKKDFNNYTYKLKELSKIKNTIPQIKSNIFILNTLDEMIDIKKYLNKLKNIEKNIDNIKNKTTINIKSKNKNNEYDKVIKSIISKKGFVIVEQNAMLNIEIESKEKKIESMENKIIKSTIQITIYNKNKTKILGKKSIIIGGSSYNGFTQAKEFAMKNFEKKLLEDKILFDISGI